MFAAGTATAMQSPPLSLKPGQHLTSCSVLVEHTFVPTLWSFIDAFTYLLITFYFCLVSEEWIPATGIGFIEGFFCLIGCIFLVESPKYLLTKRKYAEAERILNKIAGANKSQAFAFDRQLFGEEEGINFYVLVEGSPDVEEFIRGYKFNGAV